MTRTPATRSRPLRVFLSGASSGLGAAFARHYAAPGVALGLVARRAEALAALAEEFRASGAEVAVYALDVTDAAGLQAAAQDFIGRFGIPDIVIANAGISVGTLGGDAADLAAVRRVLDVNVYGLAATLAPFVAPMRAAGQGRLVGIASVAGIRGLPGAGAYSASKAAAITYLESLRLEMHGSGVKVVTICPGYIATPMTAINPYPMPFLLPAEEAIRRFARVIERGSSYAVVPWPMGIVAKALRLLPNRLYDRLFAKAPGKPRGLPL